MRRGKTKTNILASSQRLWVQTPSGEWFPPFFHTHMVDEQEITVTDTEWVAPGISAASLPPADGVRDGRDSWFTPAANGTVSRLGDLGTTSGDGSGCIGSVWTLRWPPRLPLLLCPCTCAIFCFTPGDALEPTSYLDLFVLVDG